MVKLLSGSTIQIYSAMDGMAAPTIGAADGAIPTTGWDLVAEGEYDDNVTIEKVDERTELMFQGSKGVPSEERRTKQQLMLTAVAMNTLPEFLNLAYGGSITNTSAGAGQVGISSHNLDLPLQVPKHAFLAVIDSLFDEDGSEGWKGFVYWPSATMAVGALNGAVDPEGTSMEIKEMRHATLTPLFAQVTADAA